MAKKTTNISQDKNKIMNNFLKNNNKNQLNQSKYKIYEDVIKSNVQLISKEIIDDLLYELILDLKKIEDKILWIQTIPSSWNEYEKQFLNNCLYKSGMKNNKLIYQFEAASLSIYYD